MSQNDTWTVVNQPAQIQIISEPAQTKVLPPNSRKELPWSRQKSPMCRLKHKELPTGRLSTNHPSSPRTLGRRQERRENAIDLARSEKALLEPPDASVYRLESGKRNEENAETSFASYAAN